MAVTATMEIGNSGEAVATFVGDSSAGTSPAVYIAGRCSIGVQRVSGSGTYTVQGSMDGTKWGALPTAISAVDNDNLLAVTGNPRYVRVTTASAAATVVISASAVS